MLHYAVVFLVIALIAAVLGFGGIAGTAAWLAKAPQNGTVMLGETGLIMEGLDRRGRFEVRGVPHELVQLGGDGLWPDARAARDVAKVTEALADFWGEVPYPRYLFLNVVGLAGGGLEHKGSTLMMADRFARA